MYNIRKPSIIAGDFDAMFNPSDLFSEQPLITVNGNVQNIIPTDNNLDGITVINLNPNSAGMVLIQDFQP